MLLFDHDAGSWYRWTGSHWAVDRTQRAFSWARTMVREIAAGEKARVRYVTSRASFGGSVERYAKADPAFAVTSAIWDTDHLFPGTPGGTVDLRDGTLRAARPEDRITKIAAVAPAAKADCPLWRKFLAETTCKDGDTTTFLQRMCGYRRRKNPSDGGLHLLSAPRTRSKQFLCARAESDHLQ
jgi:putative DNA primase/helicase